MTGNILSVQRISKAFGSLQALDSVSFDLEERKVSILIGPNGSGKTTLVNVVSGLYKPDSGSVLLDGVNVTGYPPYTLYKLGLGRTFQIPALFWNLTVLENLLVAERDNPGEGFFKSIFTKSWKNSEIESIEKASKILGLLGLSKLWDQPCYSLSGGQMKLVEMGRVLMSGAKLLLLDEPVSGVNPTLAHEIFARILKLRDEFGLTFFIVEHRLDVALKYVDEMLVMVLGKLLVSGRPKDVLTNQRVIDAYLGG